MQKLSFAKERKLRKFLNYAEEWELDCYLDAVNKELKVRKDFGRRSAAGRKKYKQSCSSIKRTGWMITAMVVPFFAIGFLTGYGGLGLARDIFVLKNTGTISSLAETAAMIILFGMTLFSLFGAFAYVRAGLRYISLGNMLFNVTKEREDTLNIMKSRLEQALRGYVDGKTV